jgi:hypothetical protein
MIAPEGYQMWGNVSTCSKMTMVYRLGYVQCLNTHYYLLFSLRRNSYSSFTCLSAKHIYVKSIAFHALDITRSWVRVGITQSV